MDLISSFLVFSRNWQVPLGPDCGARVPQSSLPCCQAGALITAGTSDAVWLPFQVLPSSLHVHAAAPGKLEGSSASRKRWTKYLCPYQAGTQSWLFLFAMFQSLLGLMELLTQHYKASESCCWTLRGRKNPRNLIDMVGNAIWCWHFPLFHSALLLQLK